MAFDELVTLASALLDRNGPKTGSVVREPLELMVHGAEGNSHAIHCHSKGSLLRASFLHISPWPFPRSNWVDAGIAKRLVVIKLDLPFELRVDAHNVALVVRRRFYCAPARCPDIAIDLHKPYP